MIYENKWYLYHIYIILTILINSFVRSLKYFNRTKDTYFEQNNFLFDSIKSDNFSITEIFNHNYTNIKIKKYSSNEKKQLICVLGVLVNNLGLKIEKELTYWLEKDYDIYKVYQKYPGILYEYPALKFAQWLVENKNNISFLLYLHTKGASHKMITQRDNLIKNLWKTEFSKPRNQLYISQLISNKADVVTPLRTGIITWYNGMFISKRAFQLNNILENRNRYIYEFYFKNNNTRIKGILSNHCKNMTAYLILYDNQNKNIFFINRTLNYISKIINYNYKTKYLYNILHLFIIFVIKLFLRYNKLRVKKK